LTCGYGADEGYRSDQEFRDPPELFDAIPSFNTGGVLGTARASGTRTGAATSVARLDDNVGDFLRRRFEDVPAHAAAFPRRHQAETAQQRNL
jgi:hypothetical protein